MNHRWDVGVATPEPPAHLNTQVTQACFNCDAVRITEHPVLAYRRPRKYYKVNGNVQSMAGECKRD